MHFRTRLTIGYTIFFGVVLVLLGIGLVLYVQRSLYQEIALQLISSADLIQQDFDARDLELDTYFEDPTFLLQTHPPRIEGLTATTLYVQVRTLRGDALVASASLNDRELPLSDAMRADALANRSQPIELDLEGGRVLVLVRTLRANATPVGMLEVAQPLLGANRTLRWLTIGLGIAGLTAVIVAARGGAWLAGRALQPVDEIVATVQQIVRAEDLARRVPSHEHNDEIGRLTVTINDLLNRLERLFTTQQRFVADVSHELRTPLAAMRGHIEVLRRGAAHDPAALAESLTDMARETARLSRMANDLLVLAQAEVGTHLRHEPLALDELVLEVIRELAPLALGIELQPIVAEQVAILGDRDRIKQALLNLTANALQHTPTGGRVSIALERHNDLALLSVSDTGVGIAAEQLPQIFERFYRADNQRTRQTGGAGLGLAIVKWVAEAHHGSVEASSQIGQGSTFCMRLPIGIPTAPRQPQVSERPR